ncbi:hypothetical protein NPIL_102481 [Nephila pilipes]|uniref:Uncharacterized protein n=1 Tax=Nephila pilipes TaxID=299642 RepID=A0A8X6TVC4_NEPPI|nr:hypothetical protein NPIL_102481 [Nephila pilipes]
MVGPLPEISGCNCIKDEAKKGNSLSLEAVGGMSSPSSTCYTCFRVSVGDRFNTWNVNGRYLRAKGDDKEPILDVMFYGCFRTVMGLIDSS